MRIPNTPDRFHLAAFAAALVLAATPGSARALTAQPPASVQDEDVRPLPADATPEARAAWLDLVTAFAGSAPSRAPITQFELSAEILTRNGVQTNEAKIEYAFLAPHCIRFALPSGGTTGRSGLKARDYWLKTRDGVVSLAGREYAEDRKQVQTMHAIAKNIVALSDPGRLRVTRLETMSAPPADLSDELLKTARDNLRWIRIESPDFALVVDDVEASTERTYEIELALQTAGEAKHMPRYATIRRKPEAGVAVPAPMLVRLDRFQRRNDYLMPFRIEVFPIDYAKRRPNGTYPFAADAAQEVWVLEANLAPGLTIESFTP